MTDDGHPRGGLTPGNQSLIDYVDSLDYKSISAAITHKHLAAAEATNDAGVKVYDFSKTNAKDTANMFVAELGYEATRRSSKLMGSDTDLDTFLGNYQEDGTNVFMDALLQVRFGVSKEGLEKKFEAEGTTREVVDKEAGKMGGIYLQTEIGKKADKLFEDSPAYRNALGNLKAVHGVADKISDEMMVKASEDQLKQWYMEALFETLGKLKKL